MSTLVTAKKGDTLDAVAWRTLGTTHTLPQVIRANPNLNQVEPILPAGTVVLVPTAEQPGSTIQHLIKLWD